jgi:hypothetical protein
MSVMKFLKKIRYILFLFRLTNNKFHRNDGKRTKMISFFFTLFSKNLLRWSSRQYSSERNNILDYIVIIMKIWMTAFHQYKWKKNSLGNTFMSKNKIFSYLFITTNNTIISFCVSINLFYRFFFIQRVVIILKFFFPINSLLY